MDGWIDKKSINELISKLKNIIISIKKAQDIMNLNNNEQSQYLRILSEIKYKARYCK